jgi:hypothetical protein
MKVNSLVLHPSSCRLHRSARVMELTPIRHKKTGPAGPPPRLPLHQSSVFPGYSKKILNRSELPEKYEKSFIRDFPELFERSALNPGHSKEPLDHLL